MIHVGPWRPPPDPQSCDSPGSENDTRACVTKRKISGGTMNTAGRNARDVTLGLTKTCSKLGVSFFRHLGGRLHVPGAIAILPLSDLVHWATTTT